MTSMSPRQSRPRDRRECFGSTVHPVHRRSMTSMSPRHTVHPVHRRSMTSMSPRHTVHPVHKKASRCKHGLALVVAAEVYLAFVAAAASTAINWRKSLMP